MKKKEYFSSIYGNHITQNMKDFYKLLFINPRQRWYLTVQHSEQIPRIVFKELFIKFMLFFEMKDST